MTNTAKRSDIHRPGVLVPEDYHCVLLFSAGNPEMLEPSYGREDALALYVGGTVETRNGHTYWQPGEGGRGAKVHGGIFQCDICGAHYRHGALFEHETTRELISVGWQCAEKLDLHIDSAAAESLRAEGKAAGLRARERRERWLGLAEWARANRTLLPALAIDHDIARDMRGRLISTGARFGLSEKQEALLAKLLEQSTAAPERLVPAPIEDGRQRIEGTIVSAKPYEDPYSATRWSAGRTIMKVTIKVETPEGSWLAWGTCPEILCEQAWDEHRAILDQASEARDQAAYDAESDRSSGGTGALLKGRRVAFDAKLKAGRDAHFALFSRPTKPALGPR